MCDFSACPSTVYKWTATVSVGGEIEVVQDFCWSPFNIDLSLAELQRKAEDTLQHRGFREFSIQKFDYVASPAGGII